MGEPEDLRDVFEFIDENAEIYLERLKDLCRQETVASQRRGIREGAERVAELLRGIGASPEIIPVGATRYVVTRMPGSGKGTLGFYNHFDTHPAGPTSEWRSPPFEPVVRDGALFGRGTTDNKGNLVARVCAADAYQRTRGRLPLNLVFLHDGEEEIGSPNMAEFVNDHCRLLEDARGWVWECGVKDQNGRLAVYLGFNGFVYAQLEAVTAKGDTHGSDAGLVPNAGWRLIWALSTIKTEDERITIDGFDAELRRPTESELALVRALPVDEAALKAEFGVTNWAGNSALAPALERQYLAPFINLAGMGAGSQGEGVEVILPHRAVAKLEIYLADGQDPEATEARLRSHLDVRGFGDIHVKVLAKMPPSRTSPSSRLASKVISLAGEVYDKPAVIYPVMPGASPMGYLTKRFGVPGVSAGVGHVHSRYHLPNESVRIEDFVRGIKFMAAIIDRMAKEGQDWT